MDASRTMKLLQTLFAQEQGQRMDNIRNDCLRGNPNTSTDVGHFDVLPHRGKRRKGG